MKITPKLNVSLGNLMLSSPVVCASGTFGYGEELTGLVNFKHIGAFTTKTITCDPCKGNPPPRIYETDFGVLNSIGLENPGLKIFIKEKLALIRKLPTKAIVSVGGFTNGEYGEIIKELERFKEVCAFEINFSCPNIKNKKIISQDRALTYKVTKQLRRVTNKPLIIKITPEVTDIADIACAAERAGADAISLVNTFFGMAIDCQSRRPVLGRIYGGYSGRAIKPLSLYKTWRVVHAVKIPLIAGGGIETAMDAIEFFLAGATVVSIGTINFVYPDQAAAIVKGLKDYMQKNNIADIKELQRGLYA